MPQLRLLTSTCPGPGTGSEICATSMVPFRNTAAHISAIHLSPVIRRNFLTPSGESKLNLSTFRVLRELGLLRNLESTDIVGESEALAVRIETKIFQTITMHPVLMLWIRRQESCHAI